MDGPAENDQNALTIAGGLATFTADAEYDYTSDGPNGDALNGFTATFSSSGVPNCVIRVGFPPTVATFSAGRPKTN